MSLNRIIADIDEVRDNIGYLHNLIFEADEDQVKELKAKKNAQLRRLQGLKNKLDKYGKGGFVWGVEVIDNEVDFTKCKLLFYPQSVHEHEIIDLVARDLGKSSDDLLINPQKIEFGEPL